VTSSSVPSTPGQVAPAPSRTVFSRAISGDEGTKAGRINKPAPLQAPDSGRPGNPPLSRGDSSWNAAQVEPAGITMSNCTSAISGPTFPGVKDTTGGLIAAGGHGWFGGVNGFTMPSTPPSTAFGTPSSSTRSSLADGAAPLPLATQIEETLQSVASSSEPTIEVEKEAV